MCQSHRQRLSVDNSACQNHRQKLLLVIQCAKATDRSFWWMIQCAKATDKCFWLTIQHTKATDKSFQLTIQCAKATDRETSLKDSNLLPVACVLTRSSRDRVAFSAPSGRPKGKQYLQQTAQYSRLCKQSLNNTHHITVISRSQDTPFAIPPTKAGLAQK